MGGGARCVRSALLVVCVAVLGCVASGKDGGSPPQGDVAVDTAPPPARPTAPETVVDTAPDAGTPTPDAGTPGPHAGNPPTPDAGTPAQDPGPKATVCAPTGGEPRWLQEREALTVTLRCGTGHTAPELRFTVEPLPPGATLDEESGTLRWTPGKDQAAVWLLAITERTTGETGLLKVGVADNWQAPGNVPIADPARYPEEYGLPVLHLSFVDQLSSGHYTAARLVYRGHTYAMEAKYRGATSSSFPKRSYTFKFQDEDRFNEPSLAGGFTERKRLVLISPFNDNSYLRPRLAFSLWNRMSPDHLQVKTYSAVLYVNGRYWGLYTVADHVDKGLLKRHGLNKDGDLFKAVDTDANFSRLGPDSEPKPHLALGYEKKEGLPLSGKGAYDAIAALTAFVADASGPTFQAGWGSRVEVGDYEDWWIFNTLILGTDSSAKNAYHYRDSAAGGRFRFIPWDLDATFGQSWSTHRHPPDRREDFAGDNLLFARMLADPSIAGPLRERYRALLQNELSAGEVLALLDAYAAEIHPSALRDEARWLKHYRNFERWNTRTDFTTHEQEVEYLRGWIRERWRVLERRLP